ncbi:OmpA family protein [Vibrio parahaemolyticus]|uniref:Cell envelope biogenesis protein OmpA n=1 Tax=Vibrio parahaemolyticus TaxID=670 RepID=A0AAW3IYE1_VIBPH|nr:OmpA family protein [Vibrio parahaemolyticus]EGR3355952.1 OmpA family protein [Vibrio parahaemolyticus]EJG1852653.1 OmpA family protein [Vibrio parahaemolyticus]KOY30820.1 cell envelope biogenesis protein OmpA [Vibrio parahaemolyticus]MCS0102523.1 OmpA family protein [Vibrio parahaemolyticus]ODZ73939.1 cell envelope biogenesis protein OmpA [Vibrio parahaemolyticus]
MARAKIEQHSLYLMGQLVGPDGKAITGNGLYPLPGFTLALPELAVDKTADGSNSKNESPLYFSDSSGRLQGWNTKVQSVEDLDGNKLSSSPLLISSTTDKLKPVYIPPYLIPAAVMSEDTAWTQRLTALAKDVVSSSDESIEVGVVTNRDIEQDQKRSKDPTERRFLAPELARFFIHKAEAAEAQNKGAYQRLYKGIYSEEYKQEFYYLRIPQVWTINLFFSADYFEGAEVTLSGQPENLIIKGDAKNIGNKITSRVRPVTYFDIANQASDAQDAEEVTQYVATFWITGGHLEDDDQIKQLVRFDIDLEGIKRYWEAKDVSSDSQMAQVAKLNIPNNCYSLSEQVLHLPIYSIAGRSIILSGDPISVEESLFQHAPDTFKGWLDWSKNLPYTSESKPANGVQSSINILNSIGKYKEVIAASASGVMDPFSMTTVHKAFSAGLNGDQAGDLLEVLKLAVGIDAKAKGFLDYAQKLKPPAQGTLTPISDLASALNWSNHLGSALPSVYTIPPVLQHFWHKVDDKILTPLKPAVRAIEYALDKPFGFAELVSSGLEIPKGLENSETAFNAYIDKSKEYGQKTQSVISTLLLSDEKDRQALLESEAEHKKALLEAFSDKSVSHKVLLNGSPLLEKKQAKEGEASYLTLFFEFDSANDELANSDKKLVSKVAEYLRNTKSEMLLNIEGYTCDIGSMEYNAKLSKKRAAALKSSILEDLGTDAIKWEHRISAFGKGVYADNDTSNRRLSRRAEMKFYLNSAFEYPACRSWLLALEKNRQKAVLAEMKVHKDIWKFSGQAFDIALGFAAPMLGPGAALAYGLYWSGETLVSTLDGAAKILNKEVEEYKEKQKRFSEFDVVGQALLYRGLPAFDELSVVGKAYIKRAIALNGLLRLLLLESQIKEENKTTNYISEYYAVNHLTSGQRDLDIEGYIKTYLLSDDWDLGGTWLPSFHLDEAWLETKNIYRSASESVLSFAAMTSYVTYRAKQSQVGVKALEQSQVYQKFCPIHTIADPSLTKLRSLLKAPDLSKLDDSMFAGHMVSVKVNDEWLPLEDRVNSGEAITPTMPIRVLIILDMKDKTLAKFKEEGLLTLVPVGVRPVRQNRFFDDFGSYTTEYVQEIALESLIETERAYLTEKQMLKTDTTLYGVVVSPTYYFGCNIMSGIKPIANDYGSKEWKSVFGQVDEQHSAAYVMRYLLEVGVPNVSKTESKLTYKREIVLKTQDGKEITSSTDKASIFNLTMSKEHEFLYEKTFLARAGKKAVEYPELFSDAKANLYIYDASVKSLIPGSKHDDIMEAIGWTKKQPSYDTSEKATKLLLIVSTKSVENVEQILERGGFDRHRLPVDIRLKANDARGLYNFEHQDVDLYPLGKVEVNLEKKEVSFKPKSIPQSLSEVSDHLSSNLSKLVSDLVVKEGVLSPDFVDTDLYAVEISLKYINATGKEMTGLRPFITRGNDVPYIMLDIDGKAGLSLKASSQRLHVRAIDTTAPTLFNSREIHYNQSWYEMSEKEFKAISEYTAGTTDDADSNLASLNRSKMSHKATPLSVWMNAEPIMKDYSVAKELPLSAQREQILKKWLFDGK